MANTKKKDVVREHTLQMRVNDDEYAIIEQKANQIGLTTSNYMRMVCLNARIEVSINPPNSKTK
jgi:hypothetical protein